MILESKKNCIYHNMLNINSFTIFFVCSTWDGWEPLMGGWEPKSSSRFCYAVMWLRMCYCIKKYTRGGGGQKSAKNRFVLFEWPLNLGWSFDLIINTIAQSWPSSSDKRLAVVVVVAHKLFLFVSKKRLQHCLITKKILQEPIL